MLFGDFFNVLCYAILLLFDCLYGCYETLLSTYNRFQLLNQGMENLYDTENMRIVHH